MADVTGAGRYPDQGSNASEAEWAPDSDPPEWTEEDEDRYQLRRREEARRRRRRRRQTWSFAALVLLVLGAGLAGAGIFQGWWEWPFKAEPSPTASAQPCPTPSVTAAAPAQVRVVVLNATGQSGLASSVGQELTARGYVVEAVGNDETGLEVPESAQVRHGPDQILAARSVAVQFPGSVLVEGDRGGDAVEVAVGTGFTALTPPEEVAALLQPAPAASPAGCVPAEPAG